MCDEDRWLTSLKEDLDEYDKIIFIRNPVEGKYETERIDKFIKVICHFADDCRKKQKVLILSDKETGHGGEPFALYRKISRKEADFFYKLYCMYEFSGRFFCISGQNMYGTLFSFMDTGLLSFEEMAEALLI